MNAPVSHCAAASLLLAGVLVTAAASAPAALFEGGDDAVIWRSGPNQVIEYLPIDPAEDGRNDHPVQLDADALAAALESLAFRSSGLLLAGAEVKPVFSRGQARRLAKHLAEGLGAASPLQDIAFVLEKQTTRLVVLQQQVFVAGRAFYRDGRLNIIVGDYDKFRNKAFETTYDSSGQLSVPYVFDFGSRQRGSKALNGELLDRPGVANKQAGERLREDWLLVDVEVAARAARAGEQAGGETGAAVAADAPDSDAAARQRRDLRLEVARLRQEMEALRAATSEASEAGARPDGGQAPGVEADAATLERERLRLRRELARLRAENEAGEQGTGEPAGAAGAAGAEQPPAAEAPRSVEQRLRTLERLRSEELITAEEYESKRREILDAL